MAHPQLVVFDLDMCLWEPEMFTLDDIPQNDNRHRIMGALPGGAEGVVGVRSGGSVIKVFAGALQALSDIHNNKYNGMRCACASSADTPHAVAIGTAALSILEVAPGVTVRQVLSTGWEPGFDGNIQIGRTPPLSSNKAKTHFPLLKAATGIAYDQMLFFDDCNWGDHCATVARECKGVVTVRTPNGMTTSEWQQGLKLFAKSKQ
eukprot:m.194651 g.194651  ORF g.194651 m.194651 type:complete len:205 (-) comp32538_c0_seq1:170-784(-)